MKKDWELTNSTVTLSFGLIRGSKISRKPWLEFSQVFRKVQFISSTATVHVVSDPVVSSIFPYIPLSFPPKSQSVQILKLILFVTLCNQVVWTEERAWDHGAEKQVKKLKGWGEGLNDLSGKLLPDPSRLLPGNEVDLKWAKPLFITTRGDEGHHISN